MKFISFLYLSTFLIIAIDLIYFFCKRKIKYFLFKKRKNIFFKMLYGRFDKILISFLILFNFNIFFLWLDKYGYSFKAIVFFVNVLIVSWIFYEVLKYIIYVFISIKLAQKKKVRKDLFLLIMNLTKVFIVIVIFTIFLYYIGVNITAIITSLGVGGVIIGLAFKETLGNFFDSLRLVSEDAFHQGDWIETKDFEGFIAEIGLTATKIRTFDNSLIIVPNSLLANTWIKNWSRRIIGRRIKFWLKIKYTTNIEEVNRVIKEIKKMLEKHPHIVTDKKIESKLRQKMHKNALFNIEDKYGVRKTLLVYLDEFDEYSMNILVYAFTITIDWEEWLKTKQDVYYKILKIIEKSSLELAYPTSVVFYDRKEKLWKS